MKVSIITINYNNLEGLKQTCQSIQQQTFRDWEWLVIDGGSTEGDRAFIEAHQDLMAYWCSEKDRGVYNAQNKGIAHATGDYMIFMNSGDTFYAPTVLEQVFSQPREADVLYGDWMLQFPDGSEELRQAPRTFSLHFICRDNICHQAMFIRSAVMKQHPYDESFRLYADWAKWIELALKCCTFQYVPVTVCRFLVGGMSCVINDNLKAEKCRLETECVPPAMTDTLSIVARYEQLHPLALETDVLAKKKKIYKKLIHTAIRIIHLIDR